MRTLASPDRRRFNFCHILAPHLVFCIGASHPLAGRYIAKHFKGRAVWDDKKIRHVFLLLLLHVGGLTGRRLLIFCFTAPLLWFGAGAPAWLTTAVEKRGEGDHFFLIKLQESVYAHVSVRAYVCVWHCLYASSPTSSHILISPFAGWRKLMLPMPVLSVKLIRLRAQDNSIISDSFNNRTPAPKTHTTVKPPVAQNYQTLLYFSINPADKTEPSRLAQCPVGKAAPVFPPETTERPDAAVVAVLLLRFLAAIIDLSLGCTT